MVQKHEPFCWFSVWVVPASLPPLFVLGKLGLGIDCSKTIGFLTFLSGCYPLAVCFV